LSSGSHDHLNPRARFYQLDICSPEIEAVFAREKPDVLNHHAAQINVRVSVENPKRDQEINLGGLLNLLEAAKKVGVKKCIFASSGGAIYGETQTPADETHIERPLSPYGITKLAGEKYLQFYQDVYGIDAVLLRYANVYGPRQNAKGEAGVIALFCTALLQGNDLNVFGDGTQTRDYVFVEDVVAANVLALHKNMRGIFNVATGNKCSVNELCVLLQEVSETKANVNSLPPRAGEIKQSCLDAQKLQAQGWKTNSSLQEGLKRAVEFFRRFYFGTT